MAEHPALLVAARHGLTTEDHAVDVATDDAADVLRIARLDRLAGLLHAAIAAGTVTVDATTAAAVLELWREQLVATVTVEAHMVRTAALLDGAGIRWRLTKGSAIAHLDYPDPAWRPFGDVDVVVHPDSWTAAVATITDAGYRREQPEVAPGFDARFGKGATLTAADGLEVDLHRRLAIGRFGVRLPTEELFGSGDSVLLGGRRVPTLDGPGRLLHACYHAALGGFRLLRAHRDVAQLLLVSDVDWAATAEVASRHRCTAVVARAIVDSWTALDLHVEHPAHRWATATKIGRADARVLAVFAAERPFNAQAMTAVPVLVGHGAVAYLVALAGHDGDGASSAGDVLRRARRFVRRR